MQRTQSSNVANCRNFQKAQFAGVFIGMLLLMKVLHIELCSQFFGRPSVFVDPECLKNLFNRQRLTVVAAANGSALASNSLPIRTPAPKMATIRRIGRTCRQFVASSVADILATFVADIPEQAGRKKTTISVRRRKLVLLPVRSCHRPE